MRIRHSCGGYFRQPGGVFEAAVCAQGPSTRKKWTARRREGQRARGYPVHAPGDTIHFEGLQGHAWSLVCCAGMLDPDTDVLDPQQAEAAEDEEPDPLPLAAPHRHARVRMPVCDPQGFRAEAIHSGRTTLILCLTLCLTLCFTLCVTVGSAASDEPCCSAGPHQDIVPVVPGLQGRGKF